MALAIAAILYGAVTVFVLLRVRKECSVVGVCQAELTTPTAFAAATVSLHP